MSIPLWLIVATVVAERQETAEGEAVTSDAGPGPKELDLQMLSKLLSD